MEKVFTANILGRIIDPSVFSMAYLLHRKFTPDAQPFTLLAMCFLAAYKFLIDDLIGNGNGLLGYLGSGNSDLLPLLNSAEQRFLTALRWRLDVDIDQCEESTRLGTCLGASFNFLLAQLSVKFDSFFQQEVSAAYYEFRQVCSGNKQMK